MWSYFAYLENVFKWYVAHILQQLPFPHSHNSFLDLLMLIQVALDHSFKMLCMSIRSIFILVFDSGIVASFSTVLNNATKNVLISVGERFFRILCRSWISGSQTLGIFTLMRYWQNCSLFSGQLPFKSVVSRKSGCSTSSPAFDSKMMSVCKRRICISPVTREGAAFFVIWASSVSLIVHILCPFFYCVIYLFLSIWRSYLFLIQIFFFSVIFVENTFDQSVACLFTLENLLLYRSLQLSCS